MIIFEDDPQDKQCKDVIFKLLVIYFLFIPVTGVILWLLGEAGLL